MQAITVRPGIADSVLLDHLPEPAAEDGTALLRTDCIGICGTDREIVAGKYGQAPAGQERLVIGHESFMRIVQAPAGCGFHAGDPVVGIVRRPDPEPCACCAIGEWDMCLNGNYTECGIKARNGFCAQSLRLEPEFLVPVSRELGALAVLVEPASVIAKAWEQILRVGRRARAWRPRRVLITGAGPVGLLAALMARQFEFEVHVYDRVTDGPKPDLVRDLGAHYHAPDIGSLDGIAPDITLECTGASPVVLDAMQRSAPLGIVCLAGVSSGTREIRLDVGMLNRSIVLENDLVFGSVNANRRHYVAAARSLAAADRGWLDRLITRRVPLARWPEMLALKSDDVKVVLDLAA